jgi:hypothetical protein
LFISKIIGHGTANCIGHIFRIPARIVFDYSASFLHSFFTTADRDPFFEAMQEQGRGRGESELKDLMLIPAEFSMKNKG